MSRLFLDTNILVDLSSRDRPAWQDTVRLLQVTLADERNGVCVLSSSLKDVYCLLARHYSSESFARTAVYDIVVFAEVVDLTFALVARALENDEPDFEDGLVREAALSCRADVLVTRDAQGFRAMPIPVVDAIGALAYLKQQVLGLWW